VQSGYDGLVNSSRRKHLDDAILSDPVQISRHAKTLVIHLSNALAFQFFVPELCPNGMNFPKLSDRFQKLPININN